MHLWVIQVNFQLVRLPLRPHIATLAIYIHALGHRAMIFRGIHELLPFSEPCEEQMNE